MSRKRMFSSEVMTSDNVTSLPPDVFRLFFYICIFANDDGYSSSLNFLYGVTGTSSSEVEELKKNGLLYQFDNGAVLVSSWLQQNSLSAKTYHDLMPEPYRSMVRVLPSGRYTLDLENPTALTIDEYRSIKTSRTKKKKTS